MDNDDKIINSVKQFMQRQYELEKVAHEMKIMYDAFVAEGFSYEEAFELMKTIIGGNFNG